MGPRLHVNRLEDWPALASLAPRLEEAARRTLRAGRDAAPELEATAGRDDAPADELSITCLSLEEMATLNREHLGRPGPTDVIAFDLGRGGPAPEAPGPEDPGRAGRHPVLGDIYVAPEMAIRAAESGEAASPAEEMLRLVVHGVLHVLGFTHPEAEDRWESPMYRLQEEIVRTMRDAAAEASGEGAERAESGRGDADFGGASVG